MSPSPTPIGVAVFPVTPLQQNCTLVWCRKTLKAAIIDPGASVDALLGAVGEPDIGHFFPPADESIRGISSLEILRQIAAILTEKGAIIHNIDATLIAERPKILPHVPQMKEHLAAVLGISVGQVGVKATTNERMGFPGREEGMCAMAIATVDLPFP